MAESLPWGFNGCSRSVQNEVTEIQGKQEKMAMAPHAHGNGAHNKEDRKALQCKIAFFSFQVRKKMLITFEQLNPDGAGKAVRDKKHRNMFVPCAEVVLYSLPLSCGIKYVAQTGRCLNDRLREHNCDVSDVVSGYFGIAATVVRAEVGAMFSH